MHAEACDSCARRPRRSDPFAVVLLDMQMPGMDGFTLASAIKNDPALAGTRTVILAPFGQRLESRVDGGVGRQPMPDQAGRNNLACSTRW